MWCAYEKVCRTKTKNVFLTLHFCITEDDPERKRAKGMSENVVAEKIYKT